MGNIDLMEWRTSIELCLVAFNTTTISARRARFRPRPSRSGTLNYPAEKIREDKLVSTAGLHVYEFAVP